MHILLLNGYMQNKTNLAAESILNAIENNLSKPLQVSWQIVASRHGGTIKLPKGYSNGLGKIKRLRALEDAYESPEDEIYDDLGTVVNKETEFDDQVWGKRIFLKNGLIDKNSW